MVLRLLIASMATLAWNCEVWVGRLFIGGRLLSGDGGETRVNDETVSISLPPQMQFCR